MTHHEDGAAEPVDRLAIDRAMEPVRALFRRLGIALLAVLITLPALQVLLRELFRRPFVGAEELARFMLICVVFIAFPYVISSGANIRMEELLESFPPRVRRFFRVLIALCGAVAFAIAAYATAVATIRNLNNATPTLGIPYWVFFSATFLGFLLAAVECAIQAFKAWRNLPLHVTFDAEHPADAPPKL